MPYPAAARCALRSSQDLTISLSLQPREPAQAVDMTLLASSVGVRQRRGGDRQPVQTGQVILRMPSPM